jgi:mono/diheme cytochrome c family protein
MRVLRTNAAARVARRLLVVTMGVALMAGVAAAQTFAPRDESPEDFPAGAGRDETFYTCTACHGFKLVAAQGMNRRQWDDSINWMMEKHRMPPLEAKERDTVLNYLEATFPPRAPAGGGGFQNPFMKR